MPRVTARTLAFALTVAFPATLLAQSPAADVPETHTVKQGDTLWGISKTYFNDPLQWPRLYQMNTSVVEDPHWIYPGEVIKLRSDVAITTVPTTVPTTAPGDTSAAPITIASTPVADTASREAAVATTVPDAAPAEPVASDTTPIFPRMGMTVSSTNFSAEYADNYRAVSRATFYQAGFLAEGKSLPFGTLLGITSPSQIIATTTGSAYPYSQVAIEPPAAGAYQVGDSLVVVTVGGSFGGNGPAVQPIGIIRVTDASQPKLLGVVITQYAQLSPGSKVLIAEKYVDRPGVRAAPVADGSQGTIIDWRDPHVLRGVGDVAFIDKGKADGMAIGDVLEVHRSGTINNNVPVVVPDVVARLQVVHVGDKTATTRVTWLSHPDISAGARWKLVARLPG